MEQLVDFKLSILLSLAGLLIYSLIKVGQHLKQFSLKKFWKDNKPFWIWAFLLQTIFALLVNFVPETAPSIENLVGINLEKPMAFLTSGSALAGLANWTTEKTIGVTAKIGVKGKEIESNIAVVLILIGISSFLHY